MNFESKKNTEKPEIYDSLDYRQYLQNFYSFKKVQDPSFSFQVWAEKAGIKSRSFLRLVIVGQRSLSEQTLEALLPTLELKKVEQKFFVQLVRFNSSKTHEGRKKELEELRKLLPNRLKKIYASYDYLSSHWCPKVHTLLTIENLDKTVEGLSKMTGLTLPQTFNILLKLQEMGVASEEQGQWKASGQFYELPTDLGNLAVQTFHRNSLQIAEKAIELNPGERHFQSLFLGLDPENYQLMTHEMQDMLRDLLTKYAAKSLHPTKLYQINMNMIPVSQDLIRVSVPEVKMEEMLQEEL